MDSTQRWHRFGHHQNRRTTWLPVIGAVIAIIVLGAILGQAGTRFRDLGLVLVGAGTIGAVAVWTAFVVNKQARGRDTQLQINMGASLDACDLTGADLGGAYLRHRQMNSIRLTQANCRAADFTGSTMNDAVLTRADLRHARLDNIGAPDLHGYRADFRWASLQAADLREAHFEEADLRQASFRDADLTAADFRRSDLRGADLNASSLTGVRFAGAVYDEATTWPVSMSESQRDARGLVLSSESSRQLLRGPRRLRSAFGALTAGFAASVLVAGAVVGAVSGGWSGNGGPVDSQTRVLGASEARSVITVEGDGLARVVVDDGSGTPFEGVVSLPMSWPVDPSADASVSVTAERAIGGGPLSCAIEIAGTVSSSASDGGSTSDFGAVAVTCRSNVTA